MRHVRTAILALCLLATAANPGPVEDKAASRIIVASRWGDLSKAELIDIGDGVRIRFAVETDRPLTGSRPLFYCAVEGLKPGTKLSDGEHCDAVGPIKVRLELLDDAGQVVPPRRSIAQSVQSSMQQNTKEGPEIEDATLLFARPLYVAKKARYRLTASKPDGTELATSVLTAIEERVPTWMPWEVDWQRRRTEPGGNTGEVGFVKNAAEGVAAPGWTCTASWVWKAKVDGKPFERDAAGPLPSFEKPTPETRLTFKDGVLHVTSDEKMQAREDLNFLARWWVNDRPVEAERIRRARQASGHVPQLKEFPMHLEFDPSRYGAKSGDRIKLQVAYCGFGWEWAGDEVAEALRMRFEGEGRPVLGVGPVRITNVVEFIVP
jgi:hypothetical protein